MREVVRNNISAMEVTKEGAVIYAGDQVRFQCNFGYVMRVGEEELTDGPMYSVLCQANGRWAEPLPVCKREYTWLQSSLFACLELKRPNT